MQCTTPSISNDTPKKLTPNAAQNTENKGLLVLRNPNKSQKQENNTINSNSDIKKAIAVRLKNNQNGSLRRSIELGKLNRQGFPMR
jgi:hypothetical protein